MVFMNSLRSVPVMPDAVSQPVTKPAIEVVEFAVNTCHTEVIYPTPLNLVQLADSYLE
jgi:hypothetical protein